MEPFEHPSRDLTSILHLPSVQPASSSVIDRASGPYAQVEMDLPNAIEVTLWLQREEGRRALLEHCHG